MFKSFCDFCIVSAPQSDEFDGRRLLYTDQFKLKILVVTLCSALMVACGGGAEPTSVMSPFNIISMPKRAVAMTAVAMTAQGGTAIQVYQSLYGKAPSNTQLESFVAQIGTAGDFAWANAMADDLKLLSDSAFATRVLNNMSITETSLIATPAFGSSKQAYESLQQALTGYLSMAETANRGTVVTQLAQIIASFEGETKFGVYGRAAGAFNKQVAANFSYASSTTNVIDGVVPLNGTVFCANTPRENLGADDPFHVNSWHLKNTGSTQSVSAAVNNGVAGIDANTQLVHNAGAGCTGKGIVIAINDSGLELAHEDLAPNVVGGKSFNFLTLVEDPSPPVPQATTDHGTGVAGVAVARGWNGKGSRGTAPFASVVGYAIIGATAAEANYLAFGAKSKAGTTALVTQFGNRADAVDVFNYSAGADYADPPLFEDDETLDAQTDAARTGTQTLRGGKGAVYFQASGNEYQSYSGGRRDPALPALQINCATTLGEDSAVLGAFSNLGGISCGNPNQNPTLKPYFYQVASMHNTGRASSYSNAGAANWITGFGGEDGMSEAAIISTDNSGCSSGNNNTNNEQKGEIEAIINFAVKFVADLFGNSANDPSCNYTGRMNGTSSAAPSVSGVAALMLEANPNLTWRDVGYILAKTARKVDPDIAKDARAVSFTALGSTEALTLDLPWQTNSAGFNFQNRYGFGLIDATAAVALAQNFSTPAGRRGANLIKPVTGELAMTAFGGGQYSRQERQVTFAEGGAVSGMMRVDIEVTNTQDRPINTGKLQFELVNNATGQTSILLPAFTGWYVGGKTDLMPANAVRKFRFHTNAFYGDSLAGSFTVRVIHVGGTVGFTSTLTSFSV